MLFLHAFLTWRTYLITGSYIVEHSSDGNPKTAQGPEDVFLSLIGEKPVPVGRLAKMIEGCASIGQRASWTDLLADTLRERREPEGVLEFLEWAAAEQGGAPGFRERCVSMLTAASTDQRSKAFLAAVPVAALDPGESLRRLRLLYSVRKGLHVHDKTWGCGVVSGVDAFYGKVTVDFRRKRNHALGFSHVAASLEVLPDGHLLSRFMSDPESVRRTVSDDPAGLVKAVLKSFGPSDVSRIQQILTEEIIPAEGWKTFWDAARKGLKSDPLVEIPSRRSEPLRLLDREQTCDASWYARLAAESDPETVLSKVAEALACGAPGVEARRVLASKLSYVAWAMEKTRPDLAARAAVLAESAMLGQADGWNAGKVRDALGAEREFIGAVTGLPAREIGPFLRFLSADDPAGFRALALRVLGNLTLPALSECIALTVEQGAENEVIAELGRLFAGRSVPVNVLAWSCRNLEKVFTGVGVGHADFFFRLVQAVGAPEGGERLRNQNGIRKLLQDSTWLKGVCDGMQPDERVLSLERVRTAADLDQGTSRGILAALVVLYPDLRQKMRDDGEAAEVKAVRAKPRFTSWRTYRERQEQLRDIVENQIPANSREIEQARSYGDLRENAEYKFAKEHQRLLHLRLAEFERDLKEVRGTDFEGLPTDRAGVGTRVVFRRPDGREEACEIMGEWDRDAAFGIISCKSRLSESLDGKAPGDEAVVPSGTGDQRCVVVSVAPLSDAARTWARERAGAPAAPSGDADGADLAPGENAS